MEKFQKDFAETLAHSGALFFGENLRLKDGRDTPYFVNLGGFLERTSDICQLGKYYGGMIKHLLDHGKILVDIISGPSYKGSAIAQAAATGLYKEHGYEVGFNYDRKEAKTHGEGSEAGTLFVGAKFYDNCNVLIADDVGTSMKTKKDFIGKIEAETSALSIKANLSAVLIAIDREQVNEKGEDAIKSFMDETKIKVYSIIGAKEMMQHICDKGLSIPYKQKDGGFTRAQVTPRFLDEYFNPYMEKYGVKRNE